MDSVEANSRYQSLNRSKKFPLYPHYNRHDYLGGDPTSGGGNYVESDDEENGIGFDDNDGNYNPRIYSRSFNPQSEDGGQGRYPKRRKVRTGGPSSTLSNYEFAPRSGGRMGFYGGRGGDGGGGTQDWGEQEKFVLLEVWGDRFLQLGRSSLRSEDWADVAEKVSEATKKPRTEAECRRMMDVLKRKYRKEMGREGEGFSKWAYFRKMDMLMRQERGGGGGGSGNSGGPGLACGLDSGEYCFKDTGVYLERANLNDEMRDSPCESEEDEEEDDRSKQTWDGSDGVKGLRVLADSVKKFGEIYEKIESSKREHMIELERMREDFQRELELQKKQIVERAQVEISKIREADDGEDDDEEEEEEEEEEQEQEQEGDEDEEDTEDADNDDDDVDDDDSMGNGSE